MLQIRHLKKTYNAGTDNELKLFENLSIDFEAETTALLGPNGCGKTTLLELIAGRKEQDEGAMCLQGKDITADGERARAAYIARVHQDPSDGVAPSLSVLENLALADHKGKPFTLRKLVRKERIDFYRKKLAELGLGLENKLSSLVQDLSGGQRQSLSLVMATMKEPRILLLDEHTAALDPATSQTVLEKTRELTARHRILSIMVTHEPRSALRYADRIVVLSRGSVAMDVRAETISERELLETYLHA